MRIIAGAARGRRLRTLPGRQTRPTADRVKEAMFSVLLPELDGARVLDAFAGSAALGLEALSRGAASCLFIEKNRAAAEVAAANIAAAALPGGRLLRGDVLRLLPQLKKQEPALLFDLVLADPTYADGLLTPLYETLTRCELLAPEALFVAETAAHDERFVPSGAELVNKGVYGDTAVCYYRLRRRTE